MHFMLELTLCDHSILGLPFGCPECGYRSTTEQGIKSHCGKYHSTKTKYPCKNGCGRLFTVNVQATYHMKTACPLDQKTAEKNRKKNAESGKSEKYRDYMRKRILDQKKNYKFHVAT